VGGFLNALLRQAGRTRVACLAQIVNVIAPLTTSPTGLLRQTIFYPYAWSLRFARGRVLELQVASDTYEIRADNLQPDFARNDQVPFVDVVVTHDRENNEAAVFMLNRDLDGEREIVIDWADPTPARVLSCETLTGPDLKAINTFDAPNRVVPEALEAPRAGRRMTFRLPKASYTVAHLAT
jgi:alpha-N-arabinofuranosidase